MKDWLLSDVNVLHCGEMNSKFGETAKDFMPIPVFILSIFLSGKFYGLITIMFTLLLLTMVLFHFSDLEVFPFLLVLLPSQTNHFSASPFDP